MKRILALLALLAVFGVGTALAQPPAQIPIQGFIVDTDGVPVDGAGLTITFKLYETIDAEPNAYWWTEDQDLDITDGFFTAYLGAVEAFDLADFLTHQELFLSFKLEGDDESGRISVATAAFAAYAEFSGRALGADDADMLEGYTAAELVDEYTAGTGLELVTGEFRVLQSTVEGWAEGVCYNTEDELTTLLNNNYLGIAVDACGAGSSIQQIYSDGQVDCEADDGENYPRVASTGGTFMDLTTSYAEVDSLAVSWPADGRLVVRTTGNVTAADTEIGREVTCSVQLRLGASTAHGGQILHEDACSTGLFDCQTNGWALEYVWTVSGAGSDTVYLEGKKRADTNVCVGWVHDLTATWMPAM